MVFSGIVECQGEIVTLTLLNNRDISSGIELIIRPLMDGFMNEDISLGCSIAVNGTCLTVTKFDTKNFTVALAPETLAKTSFSNSSQGSFVNLERGLKASDRNSGHTVQGHIDGTGKVISIVPEGVALRVMISTKNISQDPIERAYMNSLIVPKGFIAVDGASLTVCEVNRKEEYFTLMLIPHTQDVLRSWDKGDFLNIELDCMAKYMSSTMKAFVDPVISSLQKRASRAEYLAYAAVIACCVSLCVRTFSR